MIDQLLAKYILGIRDCLPSIPLSHFICAGSDFPNTQGSVTISILFSVSFIFMNARQRLVKG